MPIKNIDLDVEDKEKKFKKVLDQKKATAENIKKLTPFFTEANSFRKNNPEQAIIIYKKAIQKAKTLSNNENVVALIYRNMAATYQKIGKIKKAATCYSDALKIYQQLLLMYEGVDKNIYLQVSLTCSNVGSLYQEQNNFDRALAEYQEAEEWLKRYFGEKSLSNNFVRVYHDIGMLYYENPQSDRVEYALKYLKQAFDISAQLLLKKAIPKIEDLKNQAVRGNNIAAILLAKNNFEEALKYYQKALLMIEPLPNYHDEKSDIYFSIAKAYEKQGNEENALFYFQKAQQILEKRSNVIPSSSFIDVPEDEKDKKDKKYEIYLVNLKQKKSFGDNLVNLKQKKSLGDNLVNLEQKKLFGDNLLPSTSAGDKLLPIFSGFIKNYLINSNPEKTINTPPETKIKKFSSGKSYKKLFNFLSEFQKNKDVDVLSIGHNRKKFFEENPEIMVPLLALKLANEEQQEGLLEELSKEQQVTLDMDWVEPAFKYWEKLKPTETQNNYNIQAKEYLKKQVPKISELKSELEKKPKERENNKYFINNLKLENSQEKNLLPHNKQNLLFNTPQQLCFNTPQQLCFNNQKPVFKPSPVFQIKNK